MTRLLVLGMLDIQPMSGYDIQQMLKLNDAERWGGVLIGSIYHALKKNGAGKTYRGNKHRAYRYASKSCICNNRLRKKALT